MDPLAAAVLWGVLAFLVAVIVVLIVQVLTRRDEDPEPSEHER
jgi:ABC-type Co2+ transport system permease subunit